MKIKVTKTNVILDNDYILNDKEYNVNKCYFTFSDDYTNELVKKAIFVQGEKIVEEPILNNECLIPSEVLNRGIYELRVYAYKSEDDELILRYSPTPTLVYVREGSYIEGAESPEVITPSQFEQYMQALNDGLNEVENVDINAEQLSNGAKVTITNRYGEEKTVYVYDGDVGATPNITIGTVETGSPSAVTITGTPEDPVLNFVLEKGETGATGPTGNGIVSVSKTGTSGLVDTYTILFTNGNSTTFEVTNGRGIVSIEKTETVGYVDTYTITYTNGDTSTFTVTNGEVSQAELDYVSKYANALIKNTNTGTSLSINDTAECPMPMSLAPSALEQASTTGKNLMPLTNQDFTLNDVNFKVLNNGYLLINGTASALIAGSSFISDSKYPVILSAGTYTLSRSIASSQVSMGLVESDGTTSVVSLSRNESILYKEFTLTETTTLYLYFYITSGYQINNYEVGIMIESGATTPTSTDFEKFTYGASPNPDYPQTIHTVSGNNTIKIEGKNLFNPNQTLTQGQYNAGTWEYVNSRVTTDYIETKKSDQWTIYSDLGNENDVALINYNLFDENKNWLGSRTENGDSAFSGNKTHSFTINLNNVKYMRITFRRYSNASSALTINAVQNSKIQLEKGLTATSYLPYTSQTLPLNLGTIELCKIGDYQDYFYKDSGKWYLHKETNKQILNGTESYTFSTNGNCWFRAFSDILVGSGSAITSKVYSNYFTQVIRNTMPDQTNGIATTSNTNVNIKHQDYTSSNKLTDFQSWLSSHNTSVYYILATPTNTEITDSTLISQLENIYNWALSYKDQTNITQTNNDLPFIITATTVYDLNKLLTRVETLESEV